MSLSFTMPPVTAKNVDLASSHCCCLRPLPPSLLQYMALFLRDATSHRYASGDARRPMVVAGPPDEAGNCCVVAVAAKQISGKKLQVGGAACAKGWGRVANK